MRIGMIGLGKLGLPCALGMESKGHEVRGYDPKFMNYLSTMYSKMLNALDARSYGVENEAGVDDLLSESRIETAPLDNIVNWADILFVAVQTPHNQEYGGETPAPTTRRDFDYNYLGTAVREIVTIKPDAFIVIISTVLPGTLRRFILPIAPKAKIVYNPYFIAMGTVLKDFTNPEFVLLGSDNVDSYNTLRKFYASIHDKHVVATTIENAEFIKVAYNVFIGLKIGFANMLMEVCHKTPNANVDDVSAALKLATDRLISPAYLDGGMGDAGGCHPRDQIALSWLLDELKISYNICNAIIDNREAQTNWLADLIIEQHRLTGLPIVLMGMAYKPNTHLTLGSAGVLLAEMLEARGYPVLLCDPFALQRQKVPTEPSLFFISTKHDQYKLYDFPPESVVIDPFRYVVTAADVKYIPIGIGPVDE